MKNQKTIKTLVLLTILSAYVSWFLLFQAYYCSIWSYEARWFFPTMGLFLTLTFLGLTILIWKKQRWLNFFFWILIFPALVLGREKWFWMFSSLIFAWLCLMVAGWRIKWEQQERIKIRVFLILRRGFPLLGTAFSLVLAGGFYLAIVNNQSIKKVPDFEIEISRNLTDLALQATKMWLPGSEATMIKAETTVDDFLLVAITNEKGSLANQLTTEMNVNAEALTWLEQMSQQQKQKMLEENRKILGDQLGRRLTGQEKMSDVFYWLINQRANLILTGREKTNQFLPMGIALAFFLTIRSLFWFLSFPLYWTITAVLAMMKRFGWVEIAEEKITVERIA